MEIRKIIVLYSANYNYKTRMLYDMDSLIKKCDVEYWNLSKITWQEHLSEEYTEGLTVKDVCTYKELAQMIKENRKYNPLFATVICLDSFTWKLFRLLQKYKCRLCWLTTGPFPVIKYPASNTILSFNSIKIKVYNQIVKLFRMTPLCKPADYVMKCADKALCFCKTNKKTVFVNSNSGDYQNYLRLQDDNSMPLINGDYIVFVDQYLPFHNDVNVLGLNYKLDPDLYYDRLNKKLKQIEEKYCCSVVVAAHPSAIRYKEKDFFNGRRAFWGETPRLVKTCKGVVVHNTTAVSFAVLYKKPISIIMPDTPDGAYHLETEVIARELGLPIYYLGEKDSFQFSNVDDAHYNMYVKNYLTRSGGRNVSNSDILYKILLNEI